MANGSQFGRTVLMRDQLLASIATHIVKTAKSICPNPFLLNFFLLIEFSYDKLKSFNPCCLMVWMIQSFAIMNIKLIMFYHYWPTDDK